MSQTLESNWLICWMNIIWPSACSLFSPQIILFWFPPTSWFILLLLSDNILRGRASLSDTITPSWCCDVKNLSTQGILTALLKSAVVRRDAGVQSCFSSANQRKSCNIGAGSVKDVIPEPRIWFIYLKVCRQSAWHARVLRHARHESVLKHIRSFVGAPLSFPLLSLIHTVIPPSSFCPASKVNQQRSNDRNQLSGAAINESETPTSLYPSSVVLPLAEVTWL